MLRSARWCDIALVGRVVAVLAPVVLLAGAAFWLVPWGRADAPSPAEKPRSEWNVDLHGASGKLPQTGELSAQALTVLADPGRLDPGPGRTTTGGEPPIPAPAAAAYRRAELVLGRVNPDCGLSWPLLAGLGRVISQHGGGAFDAQGTTTQLILGPRLDGGPGRAEITDTDGGRLDADPEWDRAAGPMQIVPAAWLSVGADSDADGKANPHNIHDAALAAGRFLCQGGVDLRDEREQARAVFRYQHSEPFVQETIAWARVYGGAPVTPSAGSPVTMRGGPSPGARSAVRPARPPRSEQLLAGPDRPNSPPARRPAEQPTTAPTTQPTTAPSLEPTQPPAEPAGSSTAPAEAAGSPAAPAESAPAGSSTAPSQPPAEEGGSPVEMAGSPAAEPAGSAPAGSSTAPAGSSTAPSQPPAEGSPAPAQPPAEAAAPAPEASRPPAEPAPQAST